MGAHEGRHAGAAAGEVIGGLTGMFKKKKATTLPSTREPFYLAASLHQYGNHWLYRTQSYIKEGGERSRCFCGLYSDENPILELVPTGLMIMPHVLGSLVTLTPLTPKGYNRR